MESIIKSVLKFGEYFFNNFGDNHPIIANVIAGSVFLFVVMPLVPFLILPAAAIFAYCGPVKNT